MGLELNLSLDLFRDLTFRAYGFCDEFIPFVRLRTKLVPALCFLY